MFYAYGPYDLPRLKDGTFDYSTFKNNAEDQDSWSTEPGCYVICKVARKTPMAMYIGKSEGALLNRVKQHRAMISKAMLNLGVRSKLQIIMLHYQKGRGRLNSSAIDSLETELIQIAMRNGIKLENIQKTRGPTVCIAGVQNGRRGLRSPAAQPLKRAIGIRIK